MRPSRLVSPPVWLRLLRRHRAHIPATGTASAATAMVAGTTAAVAAEPIADPLGWLFRSGDEAAFPHDGAALCHATGSGLNLAPATEADD
jgi:hypothetical protein